MRTIELAGIPGSGKTCLAELLGRQGWTLPQQALARALQRNGPPGVDSLDQDQALARADDLFRQCDISISFATFWAEHPDLIHVISRIAGSLDHEPGEREYVLSILFTHCRLFQKLVTDFSGPGAVLFDEGFVQRAMTLCLPSQGRAADRKDVAAYLAGAPAPHALVLLDLDPEAALDRLRARPQGLPRRMAELGQDQCLAALNRAGRLFDSVPRILPQMPVLRMDASQEPEALAQRIGRELAALGLGPADAHSEDQNAEAAP